MDQRIDAFQKRSICDNDGIEVLNLSIRTHNSLARGNYKTIGEVKELLANHSKQELIGQNYNKRILYSFGSKSYDELVAVLSGYR